MARSLAHQDPQFAVNAKFDSFSALKHACTRAALLDVYKFVPEKVTPERYTLKCKDKTCPWQLHATTICETDIWQIRTSTQTHSCHGINHAGHKNIDEEFISIEILPQVHSDSSIKSKAIQNYFKDHYGVEISYDKAYRGKQRALKLINGSHEEAYSRLPKYCEEILRSNPGSTVQLDIDPTTNRFKRVFICFAASAAGFAYCRPLLGLDGTHLKHTYQGILLAVTAVDANGSLFSLAHAVVDAENDDNWLWFLQLLLPIIQCHASQHLINKAIVFLSDRQKGLVEAVDYIFPGCPHSYCLKHLEANLRKKFKDPNLTPFLWKAASTTIQSEFDKALEDMASINPDAVSWLQEHRKVEHWAELYFPGRRYGHLTSNIAESLNSWILEAREKPIIAMFEQIRHQLMTWFIERRSLEDATQGLLVRKAADFLQIVTNDRARRYHSVSSISRVLFEIKSVETLQNYIVNLKERTCTCTIWQSTGFPCGHAISIILDQKQDPQCYVASFFTIEWYKKTYEQILFPLDLTNVNGDALHPPPTSAISDDESSDSVLDESEVLPPSTRRPPGRPKKRRIRGQLDEVRVKRAFKCKRCGGMGHSRRTCQEAINGTD